MKSNATTIRLMLLDDHLMVRMEFATLLGAEPGFEVVAEANGAVEMFRRN